MIHFAEGHVFLDGKPFQYSPTDFAHVREKQRLWTRDGRVEVLLAPTSFLRLAEHSEVQIADARLDQISVRLIAGSAFVEVVELPKPNRLSILLGSAAVEPIRPGLYRFDAVEGMLREVRVQRGRGLALVAGAEYRLGKGRCLQLLVPSDGLEVRKFKRKNRDSLDQWNRARSHEVSRITRAASRGGSRRAPKGARNRIPPPVTPGIGH